MRYANSKKRIEDGQQKQTTTNINYIKSLCPHLITKSTYRQIKLKLNEITYKSPKMIWDQSIETFGNN